MLRKTIRRNDGSNWLWANDDVMEPPGARPLVLERPEEVSQSLVPTMQLPALYRRGIVYPLDDHSADEMSTYHVLAPIRVEYLALNGNPQKGDSQFYAIWESGIFQEINEACGIEISDYEEVELPASDIPKALQALSTIKGHDEMIGQFLKSLTALLSNAARAQRTVYFIL